MEWTLWTPVIFSIPCNSIETFNHLLINFESLVLSNCILFRSRDCGSIFFNSFMIFYCLWSLGNCVDFCIKNQVVITCFDDVVWMRANTPDLIKVSKMMIARFYYDHIIVHMDYNVGKIPILYTVYLISRGSSHLVFIKNVSSLYEFNVFNYRKPPKYYETLRWSTRSKMVGFHSI